MSKVVLVTGASSGIGKAIATFLYSKGYTVQKNVSISGEKVLLAKNVLNDLYRQLEKGFDVNFEEVDASIRMNSVENNFIKNPR